MAGDETPNEKTPRRRRACDHHRFAGVGSFAGGRRSKLRSAESAARSAPAKRRACNGQRVPSSRRSSLLRFGCHCGPDRRRRVVVVRISCTARCGRTLSARLAKVEALASRAASSSRVQTISNDIAARIAKLEAAVNASRHQRCGLTARASARLKQRSRRFRTRYRDSSRSDDHAGAARSPRPARCGAANRLPTCASRSSGNGGAAGSTDELRPYGRAHRRARDHDQIRPAEYRPEGRHLADRAVRHALVAPPCATACRAARRLRPNSRP